MGISLGVMESPKFVCVCLYVKDVSSLFNLSPLAMLYNCLHCFFAYFMQWFLPTLYKMKETRWAKESKKKTEQTNKRTKDGNRRDVDFVLFCSLMRILTECVYRVLYFKQNGRRTDIRIENKLNNWIYFAFCRRYKRTNTYTLTLTHHLRKLKSGQRIEFRENKNQSVRIRGRHINTRQKKTQCVKCLKCIYQSEEASNWYFTSIVEIRTFMSLYFSQELKKKRIFTWSVQIKTYP